MTTRLPSFASSATSLRPLRSADCAAADSMANPTNNITPRIADTSPSCCRRTPADYTMAAEECPFRDPAARHPPQDARVRSHGSLAGVGKEQLLAADLVVGDGLLPLRRHDPVDELLPEFLLHMGMLVGIHQDHAVLVE